MGGVVKKVGNLANGAINTVTQGAFGGQRSPDYQGSMNAAGNSAALGAQYAQLSREQFDWLKGLSGQNFDLQKRVTDSDLETAKQNQAQAADQWNRYKTLFAPVEERMVSDANNYDSPEQYDRVRQQAAGNANAALDVADESRRIGLTRMGVNPASGAVTDPNATSLTRAAAVSGAMNSATADLRDKAIGLRAGAASFGRNMPNTAAQAYGLNLAGNNQALSGANSTLQTVAGVTGAPTQYAIAGLTGFNNAAGAYTSDFRANTDRMLANYGLVKDLGKSAGMAMGMGR